MIRHFRGKWTKLSNYSYCTVWYGDHLYPTNEHAYQAQKSLDPGIQKMIRNAPTPAKAKAIARSVKLRPDWEEVKQPIMLALLREKFSQEPERSLLLSTGTDELVEGTDTWHDTEWGVCSGTVCPRAPHEPSGKNLLGKLL